MNILRRAVLVSLVALPLAAAAQSTPPAAKPAANAASSCKGSTPKVKLTTSSGPIVLELNRGMAPNTVDNFVKYVESGHYNGTVFHRVIDGFMIQGGGFTRDMQQKPTQAPIKIESSNGLKNDAYTVAMARTSDPNSATSQFFINVKDNGMLNYSGEMNPGYTVFGKVVEGKETVDKIRKVATGNSGPHQNVPTTPVVIEKAECV
jgi:peptidyl-prolyl cis-trans isomerase A (cyclophilin A)